MHPAATVWTVTCTPPSGTTVSTPTNTQAGAGLTVVGCDAFHAALRTTPVSREEPQQVGGGRPSNRIGVGMLTRAESWCPVQIRLPRSGQSTLSLVVDAYNPSLVPRDSDLVQGSGCSLPLPTGVQTNSICGRSSRRSGGWTGTRLEGR
jgi:hypothetical protein